MNDIFVIMGVSRSIGQELAYCRQFRVLSDGYEVCFIVACDRMIMTGVLRTVPNDSKHQRINGGSFRA